MASKAQAHLEEMRGDLWEHHGFLQQLLRMLEPGDVVKRDLGGRIHNVALDHLDELDVDPAFFAREVGVLLLLGTIAELRLLSLFTCRLESAVFAATRRLAVVASSPATSTSIRWVVVCTSAAWTRLPLLVFTGGSAPRRTVRGRIASASDRRLGSWFHYAAINHTYTTVSINTESVEMMIIIIETYLLRLPLLLSAAHDGGARCAGGALPARPPRPN